MHYFVRGVIMLKLTHFDKKGRAKMVDVSKKGETLREAVVRGSIFMNPKTFKSILSGKIAKGDVLAVAKVAGIMAAKKTSEIIPMCHPLNLSHVEINFYPFEKESRIDIEAKVKIKAPTGVEMEGFVAVATAGLTIYDMCKAIDRGIVLSNIHLVKKTGGKSGTYVGAIHACTPKCGVSARRHESPVKSSVGNGLPPAQKGLWPRGKPFGTGARSSKSSK
jgi:cyclic pyranopterin phosphate synthase